MHGWQSMGTILSTKRGCCSAKSNSLLTHIESTAFGERIIANQSQRFKASPISSCHCWAPTILIRLYQTGMLCRRSISTTSAANFRSLSEWERKTSFGSMTFTNFWQQLCPVNLRAVPALSVLNLPRHYRTLPA